MPPGKWSLATRSWWKTWATSEQAAYFTPTDWQRLSMVAALVEMFFESPEKNLMAEIRLNESKLGATPEDRARLGWRIGTPKPPEPPSYEDLYPDVGLESQ